MDIIIAFIFKVIDSMLGTTRAILVQKGKPFLAAIMVVISQVIFFNIINEVIQGDSKMLMYSVAVAGGVGTYITVKINAKISRDRTYTHILLSDKDYEITKAREFFISQKIDNLMVYTETIDSKPTNAILVFAHTKAESKLVKEYIDKSGTKIKRIEQN